MADLRVEVRDGVATVTLDRPDALNALTVPLKQALRATFEGFARDPAVRSVVLTGAGRAFCAGQDLKERLEADAAPLEVELRDRYNPLILALRRLEKPIIGAINGVAAGAGLSLALACDLRIASDAASFVLAFGRIGLVPDSGATWLLPRIVGAGRAAELALVGDPLPAAEAERWGLVTRVVASDTLLEEARAVAARLAAGPPIGLGLTKRALERSFDASLEDQLEYEATLQGIAGSTADHAEGVDAFVEKRTPVFRGE